MKKTVFDLPKMDCMSEDRLVRMALQDPPATHLDFDLAERRLSVLHPQQLLALLKPLGLQASIVETVHEFRVDSSIRKTVRRRANRLT